MYTERLSFIIHLIFSLVLSANTRAETVKSRSSTASERLEALRSVLSERGADAIIIPTADAHLTAYSGPADAHREWISEFQGSAGTALVLQSFAGLWTDGRYKLQAEQELDLTLWTLQDTSLSTTPSINNFLRQRLGETGAKVIVNGELYSHTSYVSLNNALSASNITVESDLTAMTEARGLINEPAPARTANPVTTVPIDVSGRSVPDKLSWLREKMLNKEADAFVISALDSVAYFLNLRGSDIPNNPVFYSFVVVTNVTIYIFAQPSTHEDISGHLATHGIPTSGIEIRNYTEIYDFLASLSTSLRCNCNTEEGCSEDCRRKIWVPHHYSQALYEAAEGDDNVDIITDASPIYIEKNTKNDVEAQGMIETHEKDGTALVRLLHRLQEILDAGDTIGEWQAARLADQFRSEEQGYFSPSFDAISAAGPNAAIVHYQPHQGQDRNVTKNEIYLIDSGGQYTGGTTDITRTVHYGKPSADEILAYTLVLKGQIAVATSVIPYGSSGARQDMLARHFLFQHGLNYVHGTGHGVGHRLFVHEFPIGIYSSPLADDPGFGPNVFVSDEPGYYRADHFGIRIEDVIQSVNARTPGSGTGPREDIAGSEQIMSDFEGSGSLAFKKVSLAPLALNLIDFAMLDKNEIEHVDEYHERVNRIIGSRLRLAGHDEAADWLARNTITLAQYNGSTKMAASVLIMVFSVIIHIVKC